jgi:outer membrane protein
MRLKTAVAAVLAASMAQAAIAVDLLGAWRAALRGDFEYSAAQSAGAAGQTRRDQADALWNPVVAIGATAGLAMSDSSTSGAQFSAPGFGQSNGVSFNTSINHGVSARIGITAKKPLVSGERQAQRRQLEMGADMAAIEAQGALHALGVRVAEAYFGLAEAIETERVLRRQQVAVERALSQVNERFQLGDVPVTDTYEAAARAEGVKAQVLSAQTDVLLKRAALSDITGLPASALEVAAPAGGVRLGTLPTLDQALAATEANNPLLRARAASVDLARQEVEKLAPGAATSVDLVAQLGRDRISGDGDFGSASNGATNGLIGVQVSIPLFTGGYRGARQAEASRLVEKAQAELQRARQQVALQTRTAWLGLTVGRGRIDALAESLKASNARLGATRLGREVGDRTTLELLNAESDAAAAELGVLRARIGLLLDRLRLAALAGALDEQLVMSVNASVTGAGAP